MLTLGTFLLLGTVILTLVSSEGPIEILNFESFDACSSDYLELSTSTTTATRTNEENASSKNNFFRKIPIGKVTSLSECTKVASTWREEDHPANRCRTACWYASSKNATLENQCFCMVDAIWMPIKAETEKVDSARLIWPCQEDSDCSYNGKCSHTNGRCQCSEAWKGPACGTLNLLPVDKKQLGFRDVDAKGQNISTWGAPILWDEKSKKWHGYVSEIEGGCGINAWQTNSRILHIVGNSPTGPFSRREVVFPIFAHEPSVKRGPNREWVMLFSSYRYNATGLAAVICHCENGVTPKVSPTCPFQRGSPKELAHPFRQMMSISESPYGPWSTPVEIASLSTGWDWNTAFTINSDGSAVALLRAGFTWHATNYSDPTTWKAVGNHTSNGQGPAWGIAVEDPYIYQSDAGVYHALAHAFYPFYGVHAFVKVPEPGFDWSLPLNWTVTGAAYDNAVPFTDGTFHSFARRERPQIVWMEGREGGIPVALSNGVQYAGRPSQSYFDGVFTLLQPINTKQNNVAATN